MRTLILLFAAALAAYGTGTQIVGPITTPFGTGWDGTIYVECPRGTDGAGATIAAAKISVTVTAGAFTPFTIDPGDAGSPIGRTCTARFMPKRAGASVVTSDWSEYWAVPTSATPLTIRQVRTASAGAVSAAFNYSLVSGLSAGDFLYGSASGTVARLAKPTDGTYGIQFSGGTPSWVAGGGDVTGPASAVSGNFASFSGESGKLIMDSGAKASDFAAAAYLSHNVKLYGALGNGTGDDRAAIQSALNAAVAAGGGSVYIPAGTYLISASLMPGSNTELYGDGPATIIRHNNATKFNGIEVQNKTNVVVRDLVLDGNAGQGNDGLVFSAGTTNSKAFRVWARNWTGYHFWVFESSDVTITDCVADGVTDIGFEAYTASRTSFVNSVVRNVTGAAHGFYIWNGSRNISVLGGILDMSTAGTNSAAIAINSAGTSPTEHVAVTGVTIVSPYSGVFIYGTDTAGAWDDAAKLVRYVTVTGGTISGYRHSAVQIANGAENVTISGVSMQSAASPAHGAIAFPAAATARKVTIANNVSVGGLSFAGATDIPQLVVKGNVISSTVPTSGNEHYQAAIWISGAGSTGANIEGNHMLNLGTSTNHASGISMDYDAAGVQVINNSIVDNRGASAGMTYGIRDNVAGNHKLLNVVSGATSANIWLAAVAEPVNTIAGAFRHTVVTAAGLPACNAGAEGMVYSVSDSITETWGATVAGGGSYHVETRCNGTNWTVTGK